MAKRSIVPVFIGNTVSETPPIPLWAEPDGFSPFLGSGVDIDDTEVSIGVTTLTAPTTACNLFRCTSLSPPPNRPRASLQFLSSCHRLCQLPESAKSQLMRRSSQVPNAVARTTGWSHIAPSGFRKAPWISTSSKLISGQRWFADESTRRTRLETVFVCPTKIFVPSGMSIVWYD